MRAGLVFFLAAWAGWIVAMAITVYGLGHLVRPYNASASFMMLASAAALFSAAIGVGALLGARGSVIAWRALRFPAIGMGFLSLLLGLAASAIPPKPPAAVDVLSTLIIWVVLPLGAALWARRLARAPTP